MSRYPMRWASKSKKGEVDIEAMDSTWLLNAYRKMKRLTDAGERPDQADAMPHLLAEIRSRDWGENFPPEAKVATDPDAPPMEATP